MSRPEDEAKVSAEVWPDQGWLLLVSLLTVASAMCLPGSVGEGARGCLAVRGRPFFVFSFVAAYCFWRLV